MKKKRPAKHASFARAFSVAGRGIAEAAVKERNIRIQLAVGAVTFAAAACLHFSGEKYVIIFAVCAIVIAFELLNSALEAIADIIQPEFHQAVRYAKDVAAAAVLIASIGGAVVGVWLFLPAIIHIFA
jgi:diacylglycerol kinase